MNKLKRLLLGVTILTLFFPAITSAQDEAATEEEFQPIIITIARSHWDMENEDYNFDEWKEQEKKWHDEVIMKNDLIIGSQVLLHLYTPDNSEILFVNAYRNWTDVENAAKKNSELAEAAWPDEAERDAYFKNRSEYYSNIHSDEIYASVPNGKSVAEPSTEPLVIYMRMARTSWPDDGDQSEIEAMHKEFAENTHHKSEQILGYYPMRHFYGADSRDFVEVFVTKTMADLHAYNSEGMGKLIEAHWPDEAKRKEFMKTMGKYFESWHGDLIYSNVPELVK